MKTTKEAIRLNKQLRVIGFDDAPFSKQNNSVVNISGVVCSNTRFEGMVWGELQKDGNDATDCIINLVTKNKFYAQLHAVMLDGIAFGGFNIVDLPKLSEALSLPCITVMRRMPDLLSVDNALQNFPDYESRAALLRKAGEIHNHSSFYYQCSGIDEKNAGVILDRTTDTGKVPEALRIAHLIGAAVKTGVSGSRA